MMPSAKLNRRGLLKGLAFGTGAAALAPLARMLVSEAHGVEPSAKRLVTVVTSNGMDFNQFAPLGWRGDDLKAKGVGNSDLINTRDFELPPQYEAFAPVKDKLLVLDGLPNRNGGGHTGSYVGLSCSANIGDAQQGGPGGVTFDQYVARHVSANTPFKAAVLGVSGKAETLTYTGTSASARGAPVAILCKPTASYAKLFGLVQGGGLADAERAKILLRRYSVMDAMKEDIKRLRGNLAGIEREKFDQFLVSVENSEARLRAIEDSSLAPGCGTVTAGFSDAETVEGRVQQNFEIAKSALSCGLTNVVTLCAGSSSTWDMPAGTFGFAQGFHGMGHGGGGGPAEFARWINFLAGLSVDLLQHLAQFPEGNGTMADNTVLLFLNDNGEQHHARYFRWPAIVVGGGQVIKADGRYVRYPVRTEQSETERSFAEFYNTLSRIFGAPIDNFGNFEGGTNREPNNGPLPELLV
jgi:hypothetical protein